ncbi:MAG: hypothetical protein ABSB78_13305 [Bacteroidota bacterium]
MSKTAYLIGLLCLVTASVVIVLMSDGCKKDNPVSSENTISEENLMPLALGRLWVYTVYDLDTAAGQKIPSTVHREASYVYAASITIGGKSAFGMIDSIYTPAGTLNSIDTSYLAVENGDFLQWDQGHSIWITMFKKSAGLNVEYQAGQYQETYYGTPVDIVFKGTILPKETVSAPIGTVQAYKVQVKVTAVVGGVSYDAQLVYLYFADGYGPVRIFSPPQYEAESDVKIKGQEQLLVSKNF